MTHAPELVEVRLLQVPLDLWAASTEHFEELRREMQLLAAPQPADEQHRAVPARLVRLVEALTDQYGGFSAEADRALATAWRDGRSSLDVTYRIPPQVSEASRALDEMLREVDEFCRRGEYLLTLATPADQVAFRDWSLGEFVAQVSGEPPTPWPDWLAAHPVEHLASG